MNNYMFGGLISKRTFTLFVSAIAFFVVLLGVGLGISAFATTEEETIYPEVEVLYAPQTILNTLNENYVFSGEDFAGLKLKVIYPVGCDYNPSGAEDIVEEYEITASDIQLVEMEQEIETSTDGSTGYNSIDALLTLGGKQTDFRFHISHEDETSKLCFVHFGISTKGADGEYQDDWRVYYNDQRFMCTDAGYTEVTSGDYVYFVGAEDVYIADYIGAGGDLTVPQTYSGLPVTRIMYHTFAETGTITSITIPEGIVTLESEAILNCGNISYINIPASAVDFQRNSIFYSSDSLEAINVAEGNTTLTNLNGDGVLYYNTSESSKALLIYPPKSTRTSYTIGDDVFSIASYAFIGAENLSEIIMPSEENSSLWSIGEYAFFGSGITSVDLPSSVHFMFEYAFADCKALESIDFGGVYVLPNNVCDYWHGDGDPEPSLTSVTIPESVVYICESAFSGQTSLESVTVPATVTSIFIGAFEGTSENPLIINGYAGTSAENYCTDYADTYYVQFNELTGGDFLSIPFTAAGSMGGGEGPTVSVTHADGFVSVDVFARENSEELVYCCDFEDGTVLDITIGGNGYTTYTIEDFVVGQSTLPTDIVVYAGDLDGDNNINIIDLAMMVERYSLPVSTSYPENRADYGFYDFNGSGYIDIIDIARVVENIQTLYNA